MRIAACPLPVFFGGPPVEILGFSQLKKGHFNGIVDEGDPLRQKLAFIAEFAENTKLAKKLRKSAKFAIKYFFVPFVSSWLKKSVLIRKNLRNLCSFFKKSSFFIEHSV